MALAPVVSAGLPKNVTGNISPGSMSYWDLTFSSAVPVPSDIQYNKVYPGWSLNAPPDFSPENTYQVYSSLVPLPPAVQSAEWNKINYLINNKGTYDKYVLQAAIWHYSGTTVPSDYPSYDRQQFDQIIVAADLNGDTFVPTTGQKYAVILYSPGKTTGEYQLLIIELPFPSIPAPEFPSLAIPVGMVLGLAGSVYFIKGRRE